MSADRRNRLQAAQRKLERKRKKRQERLRRVEATANLREVERVVSRRREAWARDAAARPAIAAEVKEAVAQLVSLLLGLGMPLYSAEGCGNALDETIDLVESAGGEYLAAVYKGGSCSCGEQFVMLTTTMICTRGSRCPLSPEEHQLPRGRLEHIAEFLTRLSGGGLHTTDRLKAGIERLPAWAPYAAGFEQKKQ
jgi:hypothetical protein